MRPGPPLRKNPAATHGVVLAPRKASREHGAQMRRPAAERVHRSVTGVRAAVEAHRAAGPRLHRQPFGHLVGIIILGAIVISSASAEGLPVPAARHLDHHIAVSREGRELVQPGVDGLLQGIPGFRDGERVLPYDRKAAGRRLSAQGRSGDPHGEAYAIAHGQIEAGTDRFGECPFRTIIAETVGRRGLGLQADRGREHQQHPVVKPRHC